jgi:amidase
MASDGAPSSDAANDIVTMTASALAAAIADRRLSCREVMAAHLARIAVVNPDANAIVSLRDPGDLLAEADACDAELARGHRRGPLHGLPHAVKDLAATRGLRTTFGSTLFADHVPDRDALFVERLRAAGVIVIGKTNVSEFGLGSHSYNRVWGTTRNAFDRTLSAGGSSGGAAVALALRMVPLADGSDFAGSLRNPAGWNGVYGFRPSRGRVPSLPEPDGFLQQLSTDGPMARTVGDLALLLSVMSGADVRAPLALSEPPLPAALLEGDGVGKRIGWLGDLGGALPMEDGVLALGAAALDTLRDAGCLIEEAELGIDAARIWSCWLVWRHTLVAGAFRALYEDPTSRAQLKPELIWEIEGGLALSAMDLYQASVVRTELRRCILRLFERYDALALPSAQVFAFPLEQTWPRVIAGQRKDTYHRWMEVVVPGRLSGCPVVCVPAGRDASGRAMGLQLIGRPGGDRALLGLARAYERALQS